jgi:hypothetical protein
VSTGDRPADMPVTFGYKPEALFLDLFAALASAFAPGEVKSYRTNDGRVVSYVTARTVQNRLDDVLGPTNWWDSYIPGQNSVMCSLTIRLPDGSTLTKTDAGAYAGMKDDGDDDKSGFSDALKRAAFKLGVGRYLYRDGVPVFVTTRYEFEDVRPDQVREAPHRSGGGAAPQRGSWGGGQGQPHRGGDDRDAEYAASRPASEARPSGGGGGNGGGQVRGAPRTGKALFAWTKDMEEKYEVGLLKYLNNWAKLQEFPGRMVEWDAEQVALAYREATRKLASIGHGGSDLEEALSS